MQLLMGASRLQLPYYAYIDGRKRLGDVCIRLSTRLWSLRKVKQETKRRRKKKNRDPLQRRRSTGRIGRVGRQDSDGCGWLAEKSGRIGLCRRNAGSRELGRVVRRDGAEIPNSRCSCTRSPKGSKVYIIGPKTSRKGTWTCPEGDCGGEKKWPAARAD